jgi:hypothetical protein
MPAAETKRIEVCVPGVRATFEKWIKTRGGVAIWKNISLSHCGAGDSYTPARHADGSDGTTPKDKPHWTKQFDRIITDINAFRFVKEMREVKRFHVALRISGTGLMMKCTDASSARIRRACDKAGRESSYRFDYETQKAVIELPVWED